MDAPRDHDSSQVLKYCLPARARVAPGRNVGKWDRLASAVVATAATALATRRRGLWRLPLFAVGIELLRRALTGHCYLYSTLGASTAGLSQQHLSKSYDDQIGGQLSALPYPIKRTVTVNKERIDVYARFHNAAELFREVIELHDIRQDTGHLQFWYAVNDRQPARVRFTIDHELVDRYIIWRCHIDGSHVASGMLSFADAPGNRGTEIAVAFDLTKSGLRRYVGDMLRTLITRADSIARTYLRTTKQIIETGHIVTAQMRPSALHIEPHLPAPSHAAERRDNRMPSLHH